MHKFENSSLTIYEVEDLQPLFLELLAEEKVVLDFENVTKVDMSAIQMLISLSLSAKELGLEFEIININDEIISMINISGADTILGV
jgi:anti-anti-sigma regulatory factor